MRRCVLQIVDSETVLNMISKTSTRFKVYEGVGLGEIQAATNGDVSCWVWMSGQRNTSDWLTRRCAPKELNKESHWWDGPQQVPNLWVQRERERERAQGSLEKDRPGVITKKLCAEWINLGIWSSR